MDTLAHPLLAATPSAPLATPRAWLVMTFGDDRSYAGNAGYDDEAGRSYAYDSFVPNHKRVAAGDVVILRDQQAMLGVGRIGRVDARPSIKERFRCPECGTANLAKRRKRSPTYRCESGHEFEHATVERATCTAFRAHFADYEAATGAVTLEALRAACPRYSKMNAMQEIAPAAVAAELVRRAPPTARFLAPWLAEAGAPRLDAVTGDDELPPGTDVAGGADARILRSIRARRGQQAFREALVRRFGGRCVISGCSVLDVLEAAHIRPYRAPADNAPSNGLLLRADVHTLFDLDLVGIEPGALVVHVQAPLASGEYAALAGRRVELRGAPSPDEHALAERWARFVVSAAYDAAHR